MLDHEGRSAGPELAQLSTRFRPQRSVRHEQQAVSELRQRVEASVVAAERMAGELEAARRDSEPEALRGVVTLQPGGAREDLFDLDPDGGRSLTAEEAGLSLANRPDDGRRRDGDKIVEGLRECPEAPGRVVGPMNEIPDARPGIAAASGLEPSFDHPRGAIGQSPEVVRAVAGAGAAQGDPHPLRARPTVGVGQSGREPAPSGLHRAGDARDRRGCKKKQRDEW
ncbi:MAG: hypothetical protein M5U13_03445 [Thermoanaerobaculia bacterium]|nr:hypothetical protein [Thermoanaerobaculia bacterium]